MQHRLSALGQGTQQGHARPRTSGPRRRLGQLLAVGAVVALTVVSLGAPAQATAPAGPTAAVCNANTVWDKNAPITFDGACSSYDATHAVEFAWDFNYNGTTFGPSVDIHGFPILGKSVVKSDGYNFYTESWDEVPFPGVTAPVVALRVTDKTTAASSIVTFPVRLGQHPTPPVAVIDGATLGAPSQYFYLSAYRSSDVNHDPLTFAWDVNGDGQFDDGTGLSATFHSLVLGPHQVCVQVTDHPDQNALPYGAPSSSSIACSTLTLVIPPAPTAVLDGPYTGTPGTSVMLNGYQSVSPYYVPLAYSWDLTGSAGSVTYWSSATFVVPSDASIGTVYPVCLRVSNGYAEDQTCSTLTVVAPPVDPVARVCHPEATWDRNAPITFDASCSSYDVRHRVVFTWDFGYDGTTFVPSVDSSNFPVTGLQVVKVDGFGFYTEDESGNPLPGVTPPVVAVRITDRDSGKTSVTSFPVHIRKPGSPPAADAGGPYLGSINRAVALDASASTDANADPLTFAWDLDNNGVFDDATGATTTFSRSVPGTYAICVEVTDHPDQNAAPSTAPSRSTVDCTTVELAAHAPVASAGGPYSVVAGSTVGLDASGSSDPDGLPLTYAWDLNGDGTFDDAGDATPTFGAPLSTAPGTTTTVCVRVSNGYRAAVSCAGVDVLAPPHASPVAVVTPTATVEVGSGQVAVDGSASYDPDGGTLTYAWSSSAGGTFADASAASTTWTPPPSATTGSTAILTLTVDNGFHTGTATETVTVVDTTPPTLALPGPFTVVATSRNGAVATFSASATDAGDGTDAVVCSPASGSVFPLGTTSVHCSSTDSHANTAVGSFAVTVVVSWSGFLSPRADGKSVYERGDVVPVRFALTGASAGITTLPATLRIARVVGGVAGPYAVPLASDGTTGGRFRYDTRTARYVFSLSTRALQPGTYSLLVDLGDGVGGTAVTFAVRRG